MNKRTPVLLVLIGLWVITAPLVSLAGVSGGTAVDAATDPLPEAPAAMPPDTIAPVQPIVVGTDIAAANRAIDGKEGPPQLLDTGHLMPLYDIWMNEMFCTRPTTQKALGVGVTLQCCAPGLANRTNRAPSGSPPDLSDQIAQRRLAGVRSDREPAVPAGRLITLQEDPPCIA